MILTISEIFNSHLDICQKCENALGNPDIKLCNIGNEYFRIVSNEIFKKINIKVST